MSDLFLLILEFLKTGIFSVGGGYATLPYLYEMAITHDWFTLNDLNRFIAISEITPGPIGINMATFAGYLTGGIPGGILASLAIVFFPCIFIALILKFIPDITQNNFMRKLFYGMIPCATALVAAASLNLFKNSLLGINDPFSLVIRWLLFSGLLLGVFKYKIKPFFLLLLGGMIGLFLF